MLDNHSSGHLEAAFLHGADQPPTHLRVGGDRTFRVEWIRDVRSMASRSTTEQADLIVTIEAYANETDETLTVELVLPPAPNNPRQPCWSAIKSVSQVGTAGIVQAPAPRDSGTRSQRSTACSASPRPGVAQPDWRRAKCLACGRAVVRARDAHNLLGGTLSGSWLVVWPTGPELMATTGPIPTAEAVYLLGVCHRACLAAAHALASEGRAPLEHPLAVLTWEEVDGEYTLHQPADESACPFCNSPDDLTEEHIWPRWLSKELRLMGGTFQPRLGGTRSRRCIDFTVHICRPCNNNWLSVLENDVKPIIRPMLHGHFVELAPDAQLVLATWAVKTAFLIDRFSSPIVPRGYPMDLAIQRRPPSSTIVFLAAYSGDQAAFARRDPLHFSGPDGHRPDEPNAFVVTFTAHKLAFQVIGHFTSGPMIVNDGRTGLRRALTQIWPNAASRVTWPPADILGDGGVKALAESLNDGGPRGSEPS